MPAESSNDRAVARGPAVDSVLTGLIDTVRQSMCGEFALLGKRVPFLIVAVKALQLSHVSPMPAKIGNLRVRENATYDDGERGAA